MTKMGLSGLDRWNAIRDGSPYSAFCLTSRIHQHFIETGRQQDLLVAVMLLLGVSVRLLRIEEPSFSDPDQRKALFISLIYIGGLDAEAWHGVVRNKQPALGTDITSVRPSVGLVGFR